MMENKRNVSAQFNIPMPILSELDTMRKLIGNYRNRVLREFVIEEKESKRTLSVSYGMKRPPAPKKLWIQENYDRFIADTPNEYLVEQSFLTQIGFVCSLIYTPDGENIIVGHSSGLIQMRHGSTGTVLCTLRNIQYPPKPVYALVYSLHEERVCYAACMDGAVYRIEIPNIAVSTHNPPDYCIRADPALECLNTQFYGAPGISSSATPFVTQRTPALSLGITADQTKLVVGYADASIKVYDMETQEIWDVRCQTGCVTTFEGVNICGDSIDLNKNQCIVGSWQPTEALTVWDITAKKKINVIRVQNRRPDVDGEYIYTCRYWKSTDYNRKGKYALIGGSGTSCLEVINLHNRYISCSYPAAGSVLAAASHQQRIAFAGTAPVLYIVSFHDPKHEKYKDNTEVDSSTWTPRKSALDYSSTVEQQVRSVSKVSRSE
ncbi:PREDICTED: uncharacterized protein LOC106109070 isoform X2 [Papilio polytes]|uniref:uncharacterized protein LOC106109070 isoform X2 n=1 Tax=Papilio polytes TaxID=76194 RepID=UPI0006763630|nr:PREDICTED: uncharacterized protein LOC106109070 isoform X2 [Papilio polytes]